jgi:outer membrane protein assembly factor BamB
MSGSRRRNRAWLGLALLLALGLGAAAALQFAHREQPPPEPSTEASSRQAHREPRVRWPQYGRNLARTHSSPLAISPPFRRVWSFGVDNTFLEYPPVIGRGLLAFTTDAGDVYVLDSRSGRVRWHRRLSGCAAASPAFAGKLVLVTALAPKPCTGDRGGGMSAFDAESGRLRWRVPSGPSESSPLVVRGRAVFGSWDGNVYCVDARNGRILWRFRTGGPVKGGAAYAAGTVYAASYDGHVYALSLARGRLLWRSGSLGPFYATPSVANGRVVIGSTSGVVYSLRAASGEVTWERRIGEFVYSAAALAKERVYVGSYDHRLYALDAATGSVEWAFRGPGPVSGAPTVLGPLVYFSTCGSCSAYESNPEARRTFAVDARTGALRWRFPDGEYSPVVTDGRWLYVLGYTRLYALRPSSR